MFSIQFHIHRHDSIGKIQYRFSEEFPFLSIKIFMHTKSNYSTSQDMLFSPEVKMNEISPGFNYGSIIVSGNMTIGEMEQVFSSELGLFVQISLKNGREVDDSRRIEEFLPGHLHVKEFPFRKEAVLFRDVPFGC
jgi:hypothetical protein